MVELALLYVAYVTCSLVMLFSAKKMVDRLVSAWKRRVHLKLTHGCHHVIPHSELILAQHRFLWWQIRVRYGKVICSCHSCATTGPLVTYRSSSGAARDIMNINHDV